MRDTETHSIGALTGSERPYGYIAKLQTMVKLQLVCVGSHLLSSRSLLGEFLVVVVVSIILLRSSG
jgi:hypothetical protein